MFSVLEKNVRQQITFKKRTVVVAEQLVSSLDTNIRKRTTGKEGSVDRESAKTGERDLDNLLINQRVS